jgi:hypothetical protein
MHEKPAGPLASETYGNIVIKCFGTNQKGTCSYIMLLLAVMV